MRGALRLVVVFLLTLLCGCATPVYSLPVTTAAGAASCCDAEAPILTIEYLGVGGWLFRMQDASLLTAPFFSNPGLLDVGLGRIEADSAAIERYLPPVENVEAILVGHSHYDHLMDVPYILRRRAPHARMYGSRTAVNLLLGDRDLEPERLVSVEDAAGDERAPGEWFYLPDGRVRFMALRSGHAPHFMGIHLYRGQLDEPAESLPGRATGWLEGTPLAYLIDFLSPEGEILYRIHYQDAASAPPDGFPPPLDDGKPVDLAILCPPGFDEVEGYPEEVLRRLEPRAVLLGHWEDFFQSRDEELRAVPATDLEAFIERMEAVLPPGTGWRMLAPGSSLELGGAEGLSVTFPP